MITVSNITIRFGDYALFEGVTFVVGDRDRIGLVGKNGAGKSTLLKLIAGQRSCDEGQVIVPTGQTLGYLPQELKISSDKTVFDEAMRAFEHIHQLERRAESITQEIAERTDYESDSYMNLIQELEELNHHIHILDGSSAEGETEKVLLGLGFSRSDLIRKVTEFSGGWKMRIELAKILLKRPNMLLLDEPTNHLDIESIQWFEDYLRSYDGAVLLVSHDRAFLDNVTTRTVEINSGKIYDYKASYSDYEVLQAERIDHQTAQMTNQQKHIAEAMKFVDRFRYKATKSRQVQSKLKMLDKMDRIDVDENDLSAIDFCFPPAPHAGKVIVEANGVGKSYGEKLILDNLEFIVDNGDKIAFVGRNGEGKTTMSRMIIREIDYDGELKLGHQVKIGYYAQNQDELLNPEKTVFEIIDDAAIGDVRKRVRNILGAFLFGEEDITKKVKVLSGGEKSRLALAKLLLEPVNLLVLDEPTNHLDMRSKDVLKRALIDYDGTMLVVSHDRDFLQGLTNKVYEFRNRGIRQHLGDVETYLDYHRLESLKELEQNQKVKSEKQTEVSTNKLQREERRLLDKDIRKVKNQITQIEEKIASIEKQIEEIDNKLANPDTSDKLIASGEIYKTYDALKASLEKAFEEWEAQHAQLEDMEKDRNI